MKKKPLKLDANNEIEEKIIDLSLKLKNKDREITTIQQLNKKVIGKLVHNLKNPIGVIFSFSEMLMEDTTAYSQEKLNKYLSVIHNSAKFSLSLLNKIAKFSSLQSSEATFNLQELNYVTLLNELMTDLKEKGFFENRNVETKITAKNIFLNLDKFEINEALTNIIDNAVRYSKNNGTITIGIHETQHTVETLITDNGIGISEENLSKVFDPFFVENTYSEDKQKCVGLGLAIAKKIIKNHRGSVVATSLQGKGTTFKIVLPKK